MDIQSVSSPSFEKYGRVLSAGAYPQLMRAMEETPLPDGVVYEPSAFGPDASTEGQQLQNSVFGRMPIQIGYCNGKNNTLNAVEYHRSSEINIACSDLVLLLGLEQDINRAGNTYDTARMEAFLVPQGTAVELYATTLHYAPCAQGGQKFRCIVVLPAGTNLPLESPAGTQGEDRLLFAQNKWLIAHPQSGLDKDGAFLGLIGRNLTI